MAARGDGRHTKSYVLFIGQEKSEFSQLKVRKFSRQSCVGTLIIQYGQQLICLANSHQYVWGTVDVDQFCHVPQTKQNWK